MDNFDLIDEVKKYSQCEADKYTYPIFIVGLNNKPELLGTSVAITIHGKYYLVTAAHVLLNVLKVKSPFIIGARGQYIQIVGEFVFTEHDKKDHFDIAFCELSEGVVNENNLIMLEQKHLMLASNKATPHFAFIHGYPSSKNKQKKALFKSRKFNSKTYSYAGIIQKDFEDWGKYNKNCQLHTCMTYRKTSRGSMPIHPRGISGGGVWIIPDIKRKENYFLDSILIEYHENNNIVFSTKISQIIKLIKVA